MRPFHAALSVVALAGALAFAPADSGTATPAPDPQHELRTALDHGRYADAARTAQAWLAEAEARDPRGDAVLAALNLLVEAWLGAGRATQAETQAAARRACSLAESRPGGDKDAPAASLRALGLVLLDAGAWPEATQALERALVLRRATRPADALAIAQSLEDLAQARVMTRAYDAALELLAEAAALRVARAGEPALARARGLELEAQVYRERADYARARPLVERAVALREAADPSHPGLVRAWNAQGDLEWFAGRVAAADKLFHRALELSRATLGEQHPLTAACLANRALTQRVLGAPRQALELQTRALEITHATRGPDHPETIDRLHELANLHVERGDYSAARRLYDEVEQRILARYGDESPETAVLSYNRAVLDELTNDLGSALRRTERTLELWERFLGPDHAYVALAYDSLGQIHTSLCDDESARTALEAALRIRAKGLAPDHPDMAWSLGMLAGTALRQGRPREADERSQRAVRLLRHAGRDSDVAFVQVASLRAEIEAALGRPRQARRDFDQVVPLAERLLGTEHPRVAEVRGGLAAAWLAQGQRRRALDEALHADGVRRNNLLLVLRHLDERRALAFAARRPGARDVALSALAAGTGRGPAVARVLDAVVRGRALVQDELARRRADAVAAQRDAPQIGPLRQELRAAEQRLANLVVRQAIEPSRERLGLVADARDERERAEARLADASAAFRAERASRNAGLAEVQAALPRDAALVSFVRYVHSSPDRVGSAQPAPSAYMAFVLRSGRAPVAVRIGSAAAVDADVTRWREALTGPAYQSYATRSEAWAAGTRLYRRLWAPVARHLAGATWVLLVPDGALAFVNFAALPTSRTGYLIDDWTLHQLSAERDLLGLAQPLAHPGDGLLALGDPGIAAGRRATRGLPSEAPPDRPSLGLPSGALPEARAEVRALAALWQAHGSGPARVLLGADASEAALREGASGRRVLHFATHGFFVEERAASVPEGCATIAAPDAGALAGLPLAAEPHGATTPGADDGILTSPEVAGLDLDGVEWVVLSGCETGLGRLHPGEVLGLRRAFAIAGARTVIMSLWKTHDNTNRRFMQALYKARLVDGLTTVRAMRAATLELRRDPLTPPREWAAFVALGDWR